MKVPKKLLELSGISQARFCPSSLLERSCTQELSNASPRLLPRLPPDIHKSAFSIRLVKDGTFMALSRNWNQGVSNLKQRLKRLCVPESTGSALEWPCSCSTHLRSRCSSSDLLSASFTLPPHHRRFDDCPALLVNAGGSRGASRVRDRVSCSRRLTYLTRLG